MSWIIYKGPDSEQDRLGGPDLSNFPSQGLKVLCGAWVYLGKTPRGLGGWRETIWSRQI